MTCVVCGADFTRRWGCSKQKTCSREHSRVWELQMARERYYRNKARRGAVAA